MAPLLCMTGAITMRCMLVGLSLLSRRGGATIVNKSCLSHWGFSRCLDLPERSAGCLLSGLAQHLLHKGVAEHAGGDEALFLFQRKQEINAARAKFLSPPPRAFLIWLICRSCVPVASSIATYQASITLWWRSAGVSAFHALPPTR